MEFRKFIGGITQTYMSHQELCIQLLWSCNSSSIPQRPFLSKAKGTPNQTSLDLNKMNFLMNTWRKHVD